MKSSPLNEVERLCTKICWEIDHWKDVKENGCNDPGWPDGVNLNLVRNHVFSYKRQIADLCRENEIMLPQEYYLPVPPYTDNNYFAKPKSERAKRIMDRPGWRCANLEQTGQTYEESQTTLF